MKSSWRLLAAIVCLLIPFFASADEQPTFDTLWQAANSKPDHRTIDEGRLIRVEVPSEQSIYFFTKPGQPEHPGVVKRSVVQDGPHISVQTQGWSFGDRDAQAAFERLLAQFKAQDVELRQRMGEPRNP